MMWNGTCPFWSSGLFAGWGWWGAALSLLLWVGLIAGVVFLVVWLVRRASATSALPAAAGGASFTPQASAMEVAKARYARGEITRDEYLGIIEDLR